MSGLWPSHLPSLLAYNGHTLHFHSPGSIAGTRVSLLDPANAEVARLAEGFTTFAWQKFEDVNPLDFLATLTINTFAQSNFWEPFGGLHGGFLFGSAAPSSVDSLADEGTEWHHYAMSWNRSTGEVVAYIDGALHLTHQSGETSSFLDHQPYLMLGMHCYPTAYLEEAAYTQCLPPSSFSGRLDEVAVFAGVLDAAAVTARFNQSLAARLRAGAEPDLVLLYDFEDVAHDVSLGASVAPNLGSAGGDYDLLLGRLPKPAGAEAYGAAFDDGMGGEPVGFYAPAAVPSDDPAAWPKAADPAAPLMLPLTPPPSGASAASSSPWL